MEIVNLTLGFGRTGGGGARPPGSRKRTPQAGLYVLVKKVMNYTREKAHTGYGENKEVFSHGWSHAQRRISI
jgi:hypothetical protein